MSHQVSIAPTLRISGMRGHAVKRVSACGMKPHVVGRKGWRAHPRNCIRKVTLMHVKATRVGFWRSSRQEHLIGVKGGLMHRRSGFGRESLNLRKSGELQ